MAIDLEEYIRAGAAKRGIDPEYAIRVARSEGGLKDPTRQSLVKKNGLQEPSYGPFQLLIGDGEKFPKGLGNDALARGIDPRTPEGAYAGIDFALDHAAKNGWDAWYGAKAAGITGFDGINRGMSIDSAPSSVSRGPIQGSVPPDSAGIMPPIPAAPGGGVAPSQVAASATGNVGDSIGAALFGENADKLKSLFGADATANPAKSGMGMLGSALGGSGKEAAERRQRAAQLLPSSVSIGSTDMDNQARAQGAQQLMATVLSGLRKRKPIVG